MVDQCDPDLSLFGDWPELRVYTGISGVAARACVAGEGVAPEVKSAPARGEAGGTVDLRALLDAMTLEMHEQFALFRALRENARRQVENDDTDDAAQKLLRADAKAAADAASLIVRTLEKIDGLQRQLARDRDEMNDKETESRAYGDARAFFLERIEALAEERARAIVESRS